MHHKSHMHVNRIISHADIIMLHFKLLMLDEWMQGGIITDCMTDNNIIAPT